MTPEVKQKFFELIQQILAITGWDIAIDKQADDAEVQGIIFGTPLFLDRIESVCKKDG